MGLIDDQLVPMGTAFVIAPWLATTARHVLEELFKSSTGRDVKEHDNALHRFLFFVNPGKGQPPLTFFVSRAWFTTATDIGVMLLEPACEIPATHVWDTVCLAALPPVPGTKVSAFGYPTPKVDVDDAGHVLYFDAKTTSGTVSKVHAERRDQRLSFPCFQTNARIDGAMSGGPMFNEFGQVCGVMCSTLPPFEEGEEHVSYGASIWPMLGIPIDAPWDRHPEGDRYPLFEFAEAGVFKVAGLEHIRLVSGEDMPHVSCAYPAERYSGD